MDLSRITVKIVKIIFLGLVFGCSLKGYSQQIYEIDEVKFKHTDKKSFEDGQLEDAVAITKSEIYNQKLIAGDILKLQRFYFDNGFFDASVDTSVTINFEDQEAIVTFTVT